MRTRCEDFVEGIAALAAGEVHLGAEAHVAGCRECASKLEQLRKLQARMAMPVFNAPADLIRQAKLLMGPPRARLIASTFALGTARAASAEFQLVFEVEDANARLLYVPEGSGWCVMGDVDQEEWTVSRDGRALPIDEDGRFTFKVQNLEQTEILLERGDRQIMIPSAEEVRKSDS